MLKKSMRHLTVGQASFAVLLLTGLLPGLAWADILGSHSMSMEIGGPYQYFVVNIGPQPTCGVDFSACTDIFVRQLATTDAGTVFHVTAATNPNFNQIASLLTNGVDDSIWGVLFVDSTRKSGAAGGIYENTLGGLPDFQGSTIDEIQVQFNKVVFSTDGTGIDWTLRVLGTPTAVPEPISVFLLSAPVSWFLCRLRGNSRFKV